MSSLSAAFSHAEVRTPPPRLGGPLTPNRPNLPRTNPQTPRWRKTTASIRLQGIKMASSMALRPFHVLLSGEYRTSISAMRAGNPFAMCLSSLLSAAVSSNVALTLLPLRSNLAFKSSASLTSLSSWPDHFVEVWFALREIFEPHMPDRAVGTLRVAHETACPV